MNTTALDVRLTTAAHLSNRQVAKPRIKARDLRLHAWAKTVAGALTDVGFDFSVATTADGNVLRIRTLATSKIDVAYSTPPGAWTTLLAAAYSGAAIPGAYAGGGVALFVSGANVDAFFMHTDGVTVKKMSSTDNGHTWGATSTVVVLGTQTGQVYLSAPASNILFIADSAAGATVLKVAIYNAGWTVQSWDLDASALTSLSSIYGATSCQNYFSVVALAAGDYLVIMFARAPRGYADDGIYTIRVSNLSSGSVPFWGQMTPVFVTNSSTAQPAGAQPLYVGFPKTQLVGSEIWITALEVSANAGHAIQHLCYFRSIDGINWTQTRQYLAGTDLTYTDGGQVAYTLAQLIGGQVIVAGNYLYLFGYDAAFRCNASLICGVDNAALMLDISDDVLPPIALTQPSVGSSGSVTLTLNNSAGKYNGSTIIRGGAQITIEEGYVTTAGEELATAGVYLVDEVVQDTAITEEGIVNVLTLTCRDRLRMLQEPDSMFDIFYEYFGPAVVNLPTIDSTVFLNVMNGSFFTANGELHGGMIDSSMNVPDNLAVVATNRLVDPIETIGFKCLGAWAGSYVGIVFQVNSNTDYYAVLYDGTNFTLRKASPPAAGTSPKIVAYGSALATNAIALSINTRYFLKVQCKHNRMQAWYSTDQITWTRALAADYTSTPTKASWVGAVVLGRVDISTALGENRQPADVGNDGSQYYMALNDQNPYNLGKAMTLMERFKTKQSGVLRGLSLALSRYENQPSGIPYLPDTVVEVWKDAGDGTKPAPLNDTANRIFTTTISPMSIPLQTASRIAWTYVQVNANIAVTAETYYWILVKASGNMTPAGGLLPATPMAILFMPAAYNGGYKCLFQWNPADLTTFIDFAPPYPGMGAGGGSGSTFSMFAQTSYDASGIVIQSFTLASGEPPLTIEGIAQSIVAKASVVGFDPDSWISEPFASLDSGADGTAHIWNNAPVGVWAAAGTLTGYTNSAATWAFLRTNTYLGLRGDGVIQFKMTINASGKYAGMLLRAVGPCSSFTSAYLVGFMAHATTPQVFLSKIVAGVRTTLYLVPSNAPIPVSVQLRVTVVSNAGSLLVYVNDLLAAAFWDTSIAPQGGIGFAVYENNGAGNPTASFDDLRVADVWKVVDYFACIPFESAQAALRRLIGEERIAYFMRASGNLRLSSFTRRAVVDAYSDTVVAAKLVSSDRYWFSDIQPQGGGFARRWDPARLESDGHRMHTAKYGDSATEEQAYDDGAVPMRLAGEQSRLYTLTSAAVLAAEPEDRITAVNPIDGVAATESFIISSREVTYALDDDGNPTLDQVIDLRSFVS